jgi:hypothetical protein
MKKLIHQLRRDCNPVAVDHSRFFRQWLGQPINPYQKDIISMLERIREHGAIRCHIVDPPGHNSELLLLNYFHYLLDIFPCYRGAIIYKTKRDAKILAMRHRYRCHTAGMSNPNSLRGATFHIALVIHPSRKKLREILRVLGPIISGDNPGCALIILSREPHRPRRNQQLRLPEVFYDSALLPDLDPPPIELEYYILRQLTPDAGPLKSEDTQTDRQPPSQQGSKAYLN